MLVRILTAALSLVVFTSVARSEEPVSFEGKTVTMIIGSSPGGGTDTSGRLIANFLAEHLPGKPKILVRNIPGAQGMTAMNYFVQQVVPDGLTITMGASTQGDPLFYRVPQSHYDPTKFLIIGGVGRGGSVLVIRKDAEKRLHDKKEAPAMMGALSGVPRSGMQTTAWGIEFLGWNAKWVTGYPSTSAINVALQRGEVDMTSTSNLFLIQQLVADGRFKILTQSGQLQNGDMQGRPDFGEAPMITQLMQGKLKTAVEQQAFNYWASITALDKWVALPPGTPDAYVKIYRQAFEVAVQNAQFLEMGKKISEDFEPMTWQDVTGLIKTLGETSPEAIAFTAAMLKKQGVQGD
jgi:tripartite-type tricarboxylate transporter receptor subunit TctC